MQPIDTLALKAHTRFLADDALAGRAAGTPGERIAALYIESQLRKIGLNPAGRAFQQVVPLRRSTVHSAQLLITKGTDSLFRGNVVLNAGGPTSLRPFSGPAFFAGTARHARQGEEARRGRVVVILGMLGADARTLVPKWASAGVVGVVLLVPDSSQFALLARSRGTAHYHLAFPVDEPIWQSPLPTVIAGPAIAHALLRDPVAALERVQSGGSLDLGANVDLKLTVETHSLPGSNVVAVLEGSDPRLRGEYVLYSAHYDHLGIGTPDARGDSIYNGFSDNAAGVAMLLAIAAELARQPPARSVIFAFFTAEERGLLGSTYYVRQPLVPLDKTVAVINLDAGAPPAPPVEWRVAGGARNPLGELARRVADRRGWRVQLGEASPNSDYWPFHAAGVPAVFLIPGAEWESVGPAQRESLRRRWDRYHRADDEWAEDFPFRGLRRYAEFALELGRAAAGLSPRPRSPLEPFD